MNACRPLFINLKGEYPQQVEEFVGHACGTDGDVSIFRVKSPAGWQDRKQRCEFDVYIVVLDGMLHVRAEDEECDVCAGQAYWARKGKWTQYSTIVESEYMVVAVPSYRFELITEME